MATPQKNKAKAPVQKSIEQELDDIKIIDDDSAPIQPETESEAEEPSVAKAIEIPPKPARAVELPSMPEDPDQPVTISVFSDLEPAPVIGSPSHGGFSFMDSGITKLKARHNYRVPRYVALHLVDKKIAAIVGF